MPPHPVAVVTRKLTFFYSQAKTFLCDDCIVIPGAPQNVNLLRLKSLNLFPQQKPDHIVSRCLLVPPIYDLSQSFPHLSPTKPWQIPPTKIYVVVSTQLKNHLSSWIISPSRGEHKQIFETTTQNLFALPKSKCPKTLLASSPVILKYRSLGNFQANSEEKRHGLDVSWGIQVPEKCRFNWECFIFIQIYIFKWSTHMVPFSVEVFEEDLKKNLAARSCGHHVRVAFSKSQYHFPWDKLAAKIGFRKALKL